MNQKVFNSDQLAALLIGSHMKLPLCYLCPRFAVCYGSLKSDDTIRAAYCDQHGEIESFNYHGFGEIYRHRELAERLNQTIWAL